MKVMTVIAMKSHVRRVIERGEIMSIEIIIHQNSKKPIRITVKDEKKIEKIGKYISEVLE